MLTDAAASDLALALIIEFGAPSFIGVDGDELYLSFEIGHGAALVVHAFGESSTFASAHVAQDELRSRFRIPRGTKSVELIARACRRGVDSWLARRA